MLIRSVVPFIVPDVIVLPSYVECLAYVMIRGIMGFLPVAIATLKLLTLSQKAEQPYDTLYTTRSRQLAAYTNFCNKDPVQHHVRFKGRSGFGVAEFWVSQKLFG